jgi:hypothetical protein
MDHVMTRRWRAVVVAAAATALLATPSAVAAAPVDPGEPTAVERSLRVVSRGPDGEPGRKASIVPDVSGTGRVVVFSSKAALVPDDHNGVSDIYVYDRRTHEVELLSRTPDGDPANAQSDNPKITRDGRYVVFDSFATDLVAGAGTGVYRFDRESGTMIYVARNGFWPSTSDDGQVIAYDMPGGVVYVTDLQTGETTLVSHAFDDPTRPVSESWLPEISGNGRFIGFYSYYDVIVGADDDNGIRDAYRYDRRAGTSVLASRTSDGTSGNSASEDVALSTSGRYAVFWSSATDLVEGDLDGTWQVYVTDFRSGTVELVSVDWRGDPGNDASFIPTISGDGRSVAFSSVADLVRGAQTQTFDVYVRDLDTGITTLASRDRHGDGGDGWSQMASLDQHGDVVVFASEATNLVPAATVRQYQVYVYRGPPTADGDSSTIR